MRAQRWKRFFSVTLAAFIVAGMLGACNTVSSESQTSDGASPQSQMHHLKIMGPESTNPFIKMNDRENYSVWKQFEEDLRARGLEIEVEIIPVDQYAVVSQTRTASATDLPDMLNVGWVDETTAINLANQGLLIPLEEILEYSDGTAKDFFANEGAYSRKLNTFENGKTYWFSSLVSTVWKGEECGSPWTTLIRKDWLEKLNLSVPTTAQEFIDVMKAFREQDANGNGVPDEIAVFNVSFANSIAGWFGLGSELASINFEENKVVCPWYQEGIQEYISFMKTLVDEGILDVAAVDQLDQLITENKVACTVNYGTETWLEPTVNTGDAPAAEYVPFGPCTVSDSLTAYATRDAQRMSMNRFAFTKACEDLEAAAILLDYFCSEEYHMLTEWGIEGETYKIVDGYPQFLDGIGAAYWEQMAQKGLAYGGCLWNNLIFPRMNLEQELSRTDAAAPAYKLEYLENSVDYPHYYLGSETLNEMNYMAVPTLEELDKKLEIMTDLSTYSSETLMNLILGRLSLDDWDTYISELQSLGLDEYLAIQQARYDRYQNS